VIDLIGGPEKLKAGVMSFQAIVAWNSYLAVVNHPAGEFQKLIRQNYSEVSFEYKAQFWDDDLNLVMPQFERLWNIAVSPVNSDKSGLTIDRNIAMTLSGLDQRLRESLVLSFLFLVEKQSEENAFAPYPLNWPFNIEKAFHTHGMK